MSIVDKSKAPYFDDYDPSKNFHSILFRPRQAVQTRELNQIQSIFEQQIARFGSHVFAEGSVVIPGESNYDLEFEFVTLTIDNYSNVSGLLGSSGLELVGSSGITARAKLFVPPEGSDLATYYIEYGSSSDDNEQSRFGVGETISIYLNDSVIATGTVGASGLGSKFTLSAGVYFINNKFVLVDTQTVLLDKYDNQPSKIVCIEYVEEIVDESDDNSLLDNAQGTSNFTAPGAHRLRVNTSLKVFDLGSADAIPDNCVEIFRIENGDIQKKYRGPDYNILDDVMAQRTYEESGDYSVKDFNLSFASYEETYNEVDDTKFVAQLDPGIAYVRGYRVETDGKTNVVVDKARQTNVINNSSVSAAYGFYVEVTNLSALPSLTFQTISFYDSGSTELGTARVRFVANPSVGVYRLYLFDIKSASGQRNSSFVNNSETIGSTDTVSFTADLIESELKETTFNGLMFKTNVDFVKSLNQDGVSDTSYTTVKQFTGTCDTNGQVTFSSAPNESFISQDNRFGLCLFTDSDEFIDISGISAIGGSPLGSIITLSLGQANSGRPVRVNLQVAKEQVVQKTKTKTTTSKTGTFTPGQEFSLDKADVIGINSVTDADGRDVTDLFTLNKNTTPSFYGVSYITSQNSVANPISVIFDYFVHGVGDYFGPDSYTGIDYDEIPTDQGYRLSDVLDFRPRMADTVENFTSAGSSRGNIPIPFSIIRTDVEHYLPRVDKVYLKANGEFGVAKGIPELNAKDPSDPADSMVLFKLNIPAYTFNEEDVQAVKINNRRYTMSDIGKIEQRLTNVEYYVALNNLEQETDSIQVLDPVTGANRFKNGFLTDQFVDHSVGDFAWEHYRVSIGDGELRPETSVNAVDLVFDEENSSNLVEKGGMVMLPYTETTFIKQNFRSESINVNPYAVFRWSGSVKLNPEIDSWIDTVYTTPSVTYKIYNNGRLTQAWNSWAVYWTGSSSVRSSVSTSRSRTRIRTTTTTTSTRTNVSTVGDRVIDRSVIPYMRSITVRIDGEGHRPETRLNFFFDNVNINQYVRPVSNSSYGTPVVSDQDGNFTAYFRIPRGRFKTGEKQVVVTDEADNVRELSTSFGESTFTSTGVRNTRQKRIIATRTVRTSKSTTSRRRRSIRNRVRWLDPLAQSFLVERPGGVFITSITTFFKTKDNNVPIEIQIREMDNGQPTQTIIPGGQKMLLPSDVNLSDDGSIGTNFEFDYPVYLADGAEYCFVLMSNSNNYNAFIAKMGEKDLGTEKYIAKQPYAGVMFKSQNNSTWSEDQTADVQFEIKCAKFDTGVVGNFVSHNTDFDAITLELNPIETELGSSVLKIHRKGHNYVVGSVVQLSNVVGGNGISDTLINDVDFIVSRIVNPDVFEVDLGVGNVATANGFIGGDIVEITNTVQASLLNPNIPIVELADTSVTLSAVGLSGMSIDGSETPYLETDEISVINGENNFVNVPWLVTNSNDELVNNNGESSFKIMAQLTTDNENISPVIDTVGMNVITPFIQVTGKDDYEADGGNNWANYRTRVSSLNNPADLLRIYLDVENSAVGEVLISGRFGNSEEEVDQGEWEEITDITGNTDSSTIVEKQYELSGINQFTHYQIMIQIKSKSSVNYPVCSRLRVIALSDFS